MMDKGLQELESVGPIAIYSVSDILMASNPNNRAFRPTKHLNNAAVESLRAREDEYQPNVDQPISFVPITRDQLEANRMRR